MLPLVSTQTVASERGVGGRILDEEHLGKAQAARSRTRIRTDLYFIVFSVHIEELELGDSCQQRLRLRGLNLLATF
jgi:hypothetical protein